MRNAMQAIVTQKPIRKNIEIYSKFVNPIEDLMVELDRSMTNTVNLMIKEALQARGILKIEWPSFWK